MRVLLCLSHSIEEHDQLKLLDSLGYEVTSIGGYIDPAHPHDPKRPALPQVPRYPEVKEAVDAIGSDDNLGAAQAWIPDEILEWLGDDGAIIYHHYLDRLFGQWNRIADWRRGSSGRRVIWRTVGQSVENNERQAQPFRKGGLEIVRYSPKERNIPGFAGEDALIRFYKDPAEWYGWAGRYRAITNVTQQLRVRDPHTNWRFWAEAIGFGQEHGLQDEEVYPVGPGSEMIGGGGEIPYENMRTWLRAARCYLYCGTQPASYTLGLLEALMTGIPVVSIGPDWMEIFPYGPQLFEGHELCELWSNDPHEAYYMLERLLDDDDFAQQISSRQRERAIATFGVDAVGAAWRDFLGAP